MNILKCSEYFYIIYTLYHIYVYTCIYLYTFIYIYIDIYSHILTTFLFEPLRPCKGCQVIASVGCNDAQR